MYRIHCRSSIAGTMIALAFSAGAVQATGVTARTTVTPSVLPTPTGRALVYELNAYNTSSECARIVDVRTYSDDLMIRRYQGEAIALNTITINYGASGEPEPPVRNPDASQPVDLRPGSVAIVYYFLTLDDNLPLPESLHHEIDTTACSSGATARTTASADTAVSRAAPDVVGLPFRGAGWVATDSANANGTHRRTMIPKRDANGAAIPGEFYTPERFAIDWVMADSEGRRAIGPYNRNASYFAWGQQVIAVSDGVISRVFDEMPENEPPKNPPNATEATAAGNYVMQDIGNGHHAFYAHLQPGSIRVRQGDRVTRGQIIGLLGNSGNSSEPHLHFQISDRASPLQSQGLPYVFDRYELTGRADVLGESTGRFEDFIAQPASPKFSLMPAAEQVVNADVTAAEPAAWSFPPRYPAQ